MKVLFSHEIKSGNFAKIIKVYENDFGKFYVDIRLYFKAEDSYRSTKTGAFLKIEEFEEILPFLLQNKEHMISSTIKKKNNDNIETIQMRKIWNKQSKDYIWKQDLNVKKPDDTETCIGLTECEIKRIDSIKNEIKEIISNKKFSNYFN